MTSVTVIFANVSQEIEICPLNPKFEISIYGGLLIFMVGIGPWRRATWSSLRLPCALPHGKVGWRIYYFIQGSSQG